VNPHIGIEVLEGVLTIEFGDRIKAGERINENKINRKTIVQLKIVVKMVCR